MFVICCSLFDVRCVFSVGLFGGDCSVFVVCLGLLLFVVCCELRVLCLVSGLLYVGCCCCVLVVCCVFLDGCPMYVDCCLLYSWLSLVVFTLFCVGLSMFR